MAATAQTLAEIAQKAGQLILGHYQAGAGDKARLKSDKSPVTDADEEAEKLILAELAKAFPNVPVVAEEEAAGGRIIAVARRFFLVDPLDGTKEFISGNGEFTVNIAEIVDGAPVAGAVYAPALERMFLADQHGAYEGSRRIHVRPQPAGGLTAIGSRSHHDAATAEFLKRYPVTGSISAGSSLKFCVLAAGEADVYARGGRTMEWDTAAGHAVLIAAGGRVDDWNGVNLTYGKPGYENPAFVAWGQTSP